jgi:uncharacterized protein HemX
MKSASIIVLVIVLLAVSGFAYYKQQQYVSLAAEYEEVKKQAEQYRLEFNEMRTLYDQAMVEAQVQRTICEEQLKALKSK